MSYEMFVVLLAVIASLAILGIGILITMLIIAKTESENIGEEDGRN